MANPLAFTRLTSPDPQMQLVVQDLYDKLAQAYQVIQAQSQRISSLDARVKKLGG